ncbi:RNA-splicing ligase RtcB, partial [Thermococci archaeon]
MINAKEIGRAIWEIPKGYKSCMRVPLRVYATNEIINKIEKGAFTQGANVACLPGIQKYSIMLPDAHFGYGFPIGGVAAFSLEDGV